MKYIKIPSLLCVLAAIIALSFLRTAGIKAAVSSHAGAWHVVPSPNAGTGDNHLQKIAAISASDIWAVGYSTADSSSSAQALIEHWDGTQWSVVAVPQPDGWTSDLVDVAAISASDVWAVGSFTSGTGTFALIEHWDGTQWNIVPGPNPGWYGDTLASVTTISSNNVWAVGNFTASASSNGQTLTEHWDGNQWSVVSSANVGSSYNTLESVVAVSKRDVWAAGFGLKGLVEHWDGRRWRVVLNAGFNFTAITALTSRDVWVAGYLLVNGNQQTLLEHWNGNSWRKVASPKPAGLNEFLGVTAISPRNIWAVGYANPHTLIEHWNGNRWSIVSSPDGGSQGNFLLGVTKVPGTKQVLAVGYYYMPNNDPESIGTAQTLVESYP